MPYNNNIQSLNYSLQIVIKVIFGSFPVVAGGLRFLAALHPCILSEKPLTARQLLLMEQKLFGLGSI